jgi:hypothetical protein
MHSSGRGLLVNQLHGHGPQHGNHRGVTGRICSYRVSLGQFEAGSWSVCGWDIMSDLHVVDQSLSTCHAAQAGWLADWLAGWLAGWLNG